MPTMLGGHWDFAENRFVSDYDTDMALSSTTLTGSSGTGVTQANAKMISRLGLFTAVMGGINSAIGSFYAAKTAQYEAKSQALNYQFESDMAALNARSAEYDAQTILEAGKSDIQRYTLQAGQDKATTTNRTASRGVVLGVGSARDIAASQDVVKDIDVMTINSNAVRQAWAKRTQATNYSNRSNLMRVSAQNANRTADSISPFMSTMTSLLGSASRIGTQWLADQDPRYYRRPRY